MNTEEAIKQLRSDPGCADLIRDSYLGEDLLEAAGRFEASEEFREVRRLIGAQLHNGRVLDLGAGNGIASRAFARSGAELVYALEPDPSDEIGRGAIHSLTVDHNVELIEAYGEEIPLPDAEVDIVYTRQVLHHTNDLPQVLRECSRVLKPGGAFLACREHVVDDERQLRAFLEDHPVHGLTGGENAFRLDEYISAIRSSGLVLEKVFGPWDTVINAFPTVRTSGDLEAYPRIVLERRFGWFGTLAALVPGATPLVWRRLKRPTPGRLYSFLATKP